MDFLKFRPPQCLQPCRRSSISIHLLHETSSIYSGKSLVRYGEQEGAINHFCILQYVRLLWLCKYMACYEYLHFPYLKFSILFLLEDFSVFEFILIDNLKQLTPKLFSACFRTKHSLFKSLHFLPSSFDQISFFLNHISFIAHLLFALRLVGFFLFLFCCFLEVFLKDLYF